MVIISCQSLNLYIIMAKILIPAIHLLNSIVATIYAFSLKIILYNIWKNIFINRYERPNMMKDCNEFLKETKTIKLYLIKFKEDIL